MRFKQTPQPAAYIGRSRNMDGLNVNFESIFTTPVNTVPLFVKRTWDELHPGPPYREGGPFNSFSSSNPLYLVQGHGKWQTQKGGPSGQAYTEYEGGFAPLGLPFRDLGDNSYYSNVGILPPFGLAWASAAPYYSQAYSGMLPRVEKTDLATFLGELRDFPRMLKTTAESFHNIWKNLGGDTSSLFMRPKRVADNFLNHQFGWAPFTSDLLEFEKVHQKSGDYIRDITRMNGQNVRRRRVIHQTEDASSYHPREHFPWVEPYPSISGMMELRNVDGVVCRGYTDFTKRVYSKVWSVASFKFYRPEFDASKSWYSSRYGHITRLMTLYGLRVSPSAIWNLMPWSWLVDWFGNVGKYIDAFDSWAVDGVVNNYAFVCRNRREEYIQRCIIHMPNDTVVVSWTSHAESKLRDRAGSPYGFDLTWDDLSARQLAILASLGISRRR